MEQEQGQRQEGRLKKLDDLLEPRRKLARLEEVTDQSVEVRKLLKLVESLRISTSKFSAGNIKSTFPAWKELTSDREILQTVSGLKVDLCDLNEALPTPFESRLSGSQAEIVSSEIAKLNELKF